MQRCLPEAVDSSSEVIFKTLILIHCQNILIPLNSLLPCSSLNSALLTFCCYFDPVVPIVTRDFLLNTLLSLPSVARDLLFVLCPALSWSFQCLFLVIVLLFQPYQNWKTQPPQLCPALVLFVSLFVCFFSFLLKTFDFVL